MVTQGLRVGDVVWIAPAKDTVPHPGVVIHIAKDGRNAVVITGTSVGPRLGYSVEMVDPKRRANAALQLKNKTFFYQHAVHRCAVDELERLQRDALARSSVRIAPRCPIALWEKLYALASAGVRAKIAAGVWSEDAKLE